MVLKKSKSKNRLRTTSLEEAFHPHAGYPRQYLSISLPGTGQQIAIVKTQSFTWNTPLLISHSEMGNQKVRKTFPDLNEGAGSPTSCLQS
jgi:hypothetical protein